MDKDDLTEDGIQALGRKLEAMKATGIYEDWRQKLRKDAEEFEASPRGRLGRITSHIQSQWWRLTGKIPW